MYSLNEWVDFDDGNPQSDYEKGYAQARKWVRDVGLYGKVAIGKRELKFIKHTIVMLGSGECRLSEKYEAKVRSFQDIDEALIGDREALQPVNYVEKYGLTGMTGYELARLLLNFNNYEEMGNVVDCWRNANTEIPLSDTITLPNKLSPDLADQMSKQLSLYDGETYLTGPCDPSDLIKDWSEFTKEFALNKVLKGN